MGVSKGALVKPGRNPDRTVVWLTFAKLPRPRRKYQQINELRKDAPELSRVRPWPQSLTSSLDENRLTLCLQNRDLWSKRFRIMEQLGASAAPIAGSPDAREPIIQLAVRLFTFAGPAFRN